MQVQILGPFGKTKLLTDVATMGVTFGKTWAILFQHLVALIILTDKLKSLFVHIFVTTEITLFHFCFHDVSRRLDRRTSATEMFTTISWRSSWRSIS